MKSNSSTNLFLVMLLAVDLVVQGVVRALDDGLTHAALFSAELESQKKHYVM